MASNVAKWADIGDSFASGIGAGVRRDVASGDTVCSRYTEAYGNVMNVVLDGTGPVNRHFTWVACSGATTPAVLKNQISAIDKDSDIVTLQVGGNDVGFFDIINACIIKLLPQSTTCPEQITLSGNLIANSYPALIDSDIQAVLKQVENAGFKLYVIGYAQFFNPTTTQCENVSFDFWRELPENQGNLTSALRTTLNGLATSLNTQISDAVDRANAHDERKPVVFVDWDSAFAGHRYCDEGIDEPDLTNENRWFQENNLFTRDQDPWSANAIAVQYLDWAQQAYTANPDLVLSSMYANGFQVAGGKINPTDVGWHWLFDDLARIFHPTIDGHNAIKDVILASYTASPPSVAQATSAAAKSVTCLHEADPDSTCSAIADSKGYCECNNDGTTYAMMTTGTVPCGWTTLPATTSFHCPTTTTTTSSTHHAKCTATFSGDCTGVSQCGCPTSATISVCANG